MDKEAIIKEISEHIRTSGRSHYFEFYIGVTNDVERRLFDEHRVYRKGMCWIYVRADNAAIAREVERYYQDLGMRGSTGGGDDESTYVYCYEVKPWTAE